MTDVTPATALDLDAIRARAEAASAVWSMGSHAHPVKGCRCGSCWQPATLSQPGGLFCDDVGEREHDGIGDPDEGDRCDQFGYRWPDADFIVHARDDMLALLAEVERLRKRVPPLMWCEGGEMSVVTDPAAFFSRPRPVEPFNIPIHVTDALPPGRVIAVSGPHGYNSDGSPIVSAAAADFDPPETTP